MTKMANKNILQDQSYSAKLFLPSVDLLQLYLWAYRNSCAAVIQKASNAPKLACRIHQYYRRQ